MTMTSAMGRKLSKMGWPSNECGIVRIGALVFSFKLFYCSGFREKRKNTGKL